jgi:site-specific recombinase XerD
MTIQMQSSFDYFEVSKELGIPYETFMDFIRQYHGDGERPQDLSDDSPTSIRDAVDRFLSNLKLRVDLKDKSVETYKTYKSFLLNFSAFLLDKDSQFRLELLSEVHFLNFLQQSKVRTGKEVSRYTKNTYMGILRSFFKFCLNEKWISLNLSDRFDKKKKPPLLPRYIRDEHLEAILNESKKLVNGYRNHAILHVLYGTGLRISELLNLRVGDIDRTRKVIKVRSGKGDKERWVTLYPKIDQIIMDYLNLTGLKTLKPHHEGFVFAKDYGETRIKPITRDAVEKMMKRICKRIGLEQVYTPHSLRHTYAVHNLMAGTKITYLSQVMGHASIDTTMVYTQLQPDHIGEILSANFPLPMDKFVYRLLEADFDETTD